MKYIGAAYLCWMGIQALLAAFKGVKNTGQVAPAKKQRTLLKAYIKRFQ